MYPVFTHKTDAMKKLQQLAARGGYSRYASGKIETKKLETMLYKFEDRYRINATKQMRYRAKQRGEANSEIVLLLDGENVQFWLMVSPGQGAVIDMEKPHELTDKKHRLVITGYELVRVQKSDTVRWTWRMTKESHAEFEQRIKDACRHKNADHIRQAFHSLQHMPVFSEMRLQAFALFKLLRSEYRRSHKEDYPDDLKKNFYGRFKTPQTLSAVDISRKARRAMDLTEKRDRAALREKLRAEISNAEDLLARMNEYHEKTDHRETGEIYFEERIQIQQQEQVLLELREQLENL